MNQSSVRTLLIGLLLLFIAHCSLFTEAHAQGIVSIRSGATVPANCAPRSNNGLFYKNSGANIGLHECTAANTWTYRGALNFGGTLTPTALSGDVNNYSPTNLASSFAIRIDGGAADRNITGLATGSDGRLVLIINIGSTNTLTLVNQSGSSTAANRFLIGADLVLPVNSSAFLRYDGTTARWRPVGQVLSNSGVTAGSYGPSTITIGADGRITAASTTTNTALNTPQFCSDAGGSDTYACSLSPAIASYVTGTHYRFKANTANTGAATINFNSLGAITIVKTQGGITTALADNDIRSGSWVDVVYDGTNMQMVSARANYPATTDLTTSVSGPLAGNGSAVAAATVTQTEAIVFCADAGASDTYACSLSPAPAAYVTGTHYRFKANTANTGAATINFNSLGAITIVKVAGGITTTLADNDILAGQWVDVVYDGTNMQMQSLLGNAPGTSSFADPGGNGIVVRTALNTSTNRALTAGSAAVTVTNGDGTAGNPTVNLPYTLYVATVTQSSTSAPVATVQTNTTGTTFTWARSTTGTYTITAGSAILAADKTGMLGMAAPAGASVTMLRTSTTVITVRTWDGSGASLSDGLLTENTFEIRIYP